MSDWKHKKVKPPAGYPYEDWSEGVYLEAADKYIAELEAKLERLEDIRRAAHNYINVRGVNNVKAANELRDALAALKGEQDGD